LKEFNELFEKERKNRLIFDKPCFSIDEPNSQALDDCLTINKWIGNEGEVYYDLWIHQPDVSFLME